MRIDEWVMWPWWVATLPALIEGAIWLIISIAMLPSVFSQMKENKALDKTDRVPTLYPLLLLINDILCVIALYCFVLCLDKVWKVKFTTALIPYFIYALNYIYMPFLNPDEERNMLKDFSDGLSNVVIALTVYLVAAKHDGIISWSWELTFLFVWIYYGLQILLLQCMRCGLQATRTEVRLL